MTSKEKVSAYVQSVLGTDSLPAISAAAQRSERMIEHAAQAIEQATESMSKELLEATGDFTVVAVGSVGRGEATEGSDLDFVTLFAGAEDDTGNDERVQVDRQFRKMVLEAANGIEKVSKGEDLTAPVTVGELADPNSVGGDQDTVATHTRRILLLTESRAIFSSSSDMRLKARDSIFDIYQRSEATKGRHLLTLSNDIARYYRTLGMDYKHRIDVQDKAWGIRNVKLRHTRKNWYLSTALAVVASTADREYLEEEEEALVKELFELPPCYRLAFALREAGLDAHVSALRLYDRFLKEIGSPGVRDELQQVDHENRYGNEVFRRLKDNSDHLHERYLDIVGDLPPHWKRHLISHFLL